MTEEDYWRLLDRIEAALEESSGKVLGLISQADIYSDNSREMILEDIQEAILSIEKLSGVIRQYQETVKDG